MARAALAPIFGLLLLAYSGARLNEGASDYRFRTLSDLRTRYFLPSAVLDYLEEGDSISVRLVHYSDADVLPTVQIDYWNIRMRKQEPSMPGWLTRSRIRTGCGATGGAALRGVLGL